MALTELDGHWVADATSTGDIREAVELASEEAARLLVEQWGFALTRRSSSFGGLRRGHRAVLPGVAVVIDHTHNDSQDHGVPPAVRKLSPAGSCWRFLRTPT